MATHNVSRLLASLYNSPHLCDERTFEFATGFLHNRSKYGLMVPMDRPMGPEQDDAEEPDDLDDFDPEMGIGVLNVEGPLTYRKIVGMCGEIGCSYESMLEQCDEMIEAGAKTIIMSIDSGGGQGYGAFECANEIRKRCDDAGVKLYSYNDGCMCSAAYVFGCVADEVVTNPHAETGSIGVLVALLNDSKYLEKEGITRTFITAGESKVPFANDGSWREGFLEDIQTKVDALYGDFVSHVVNYTGLSAEAVKNTEAKTFMANDALSLGLVNHIMTRSEFIQYVLDKHKGASNA